jgi:hypothetical protein
MKKTFFFILPFIFSFPAFCQEYENEEEVKLKRNDAIVINLLNNYWYNVEPPMKIMPVSLGIEIYTYQTLFKSDKTFNISLGIGISSHNVHNNSLPYDSLEVTYFKLIPPGYEYTKNKLSINYIDVPLEMDIVSKSDKRNRNFRFALGGKAGIMVSNYLKYVGEDFRTNSSKIVKFKEYRIDNIMWYRFGIYTRVSFARFGFVVNYYFTPIFEKNKGPNFIPLTYGLTFSLK